MHSFNNNTTNITLIMIDKLVEIDKAVFLFFNSKNHELLDPLMLALSSYVLWGIVFVIFAALIFFRSKTHKIVPVVYYTAAVAISSLGTNLVKLVIQRPRPIHEEEWKGVIHNIEKYSAAYSFYSSHAATAFAIAMFAWLYFKTQKTYGAIAFVWAIGVSYSRIYVGKHYPGDVLFGTAFGLLCGYAGYRLLEKYLVKKEDSLQ